MLEDTVGGSFALMFSFVSPQCAVIRQTLIELEPKVEWEPIVW